MKADLRGIVGLASLVLLAHVVSGQTVTPDYNNHDAIDAYRRSIQESALHQQTIAAGGTLHRIRRTEPAKLAGDLQSLVKQSDEIVLVQIARNSCQVSPSGEEPITMYQAGVIRRWKGFGSDSIVFSVPFGMVVFDRDTRADASIPGFQPPRNGHRYVLFLRFSYGDERQLAPALRLVGDSVQGAFEVSDETINPAFHLDSLDQKYMGVPVPQFLKEVQSAVDAQKQP